MPWRSIKNNERNGYIKSELIKKSKENKSFICKVSVLIYNIRVTRISILIFY